MLTGYSAERLYDLGFLGDKEIPFEDIKARARAEGAVRAAAPAPDDAFPARWREKMGLQNHLPQ